mmetsp:Transcript_1456/g.1923  ORF Transcript_1456/g.1923 Transcript_1456/m.1923 type:complete len:603 (-) Transcript_1456:132-1940(-)
MNENIEEKEEKIEERIVRYVGSFVCLGGFAWGMDLGSVSGALPGIRTRFNLSRVEIGTFVGLASPGEVLGAFIAGIVSDKLGRRNGIVLCDVSFCASGLILALATSKIQLFIGRFTAGFAAGSAIVSQVLYASELAPSKRRGKATAFFEVAISIGFTFSFFVFFLAEHSTNSKNESRSWRLLFALPTIPAFCQLILLYCYAPESPAWLEAIGKLSQVQRVLIYIQHYSRASTHIIYSIYSSHLDATTLEKTINKQDEQRKLMISETFKKSTSWTSEAWQWRFPLLLMYSCSFLTFAGGGFNIRIFAVEILQAQSGWSQPDAASGVLALGIVKLVATLYALYYIDIIGRRPFLLASLLGSAVSAFAIALWLHLAPSFIKRILILVALLTYTISFQLGFGVCNFILVGEIFPSHIKGRLAALLKGPTAFLAFCTQIIFEIALNRKSTLILLFFVQFVVNILGFLLFRVGFVETKHLDAHTIKQRLAATPLASFFSRRKKCTFFISGAIAAGVRKQTSQELSPTQKDKDRGAYFAEKQEPNDSRGRHRRLHSKDEEDYDDECEETPFSAIELVPKNNNIIISESDSFGEDPPLLVQHHQADKAFV